MRKFLFVVLFFSYFAVAYADEAHTVMVILESKPGKEEELKAALVKVAAKSRLESSCMEYHVYQDKGQPARFGLYEKWKSKELHQEQFKKSYIIDFSKQAESLLAIPYDVVLGREI